jgi:hypothetical protein
VIKVLLSGCGRVSKYIHEVKMEKGMGQHFPHECNLVREIWCGNMMQMVRREQDVKIRRVRLTTFG